jgi:hypothetical protein
LSALSFMYHLHFFILFLSLSLSLSFSDIFGKPLRPTFKLFSYCAVLKVFNPHCSIFASRCFINRRIGQN